MIVTSRKEVFYKIEMTAQQAADLQLLLETSRDGHVNELRVQENHGTKVADDVHETVKAMLEALETRGCTT